MFLTPITISSMYGPGRSAVDYFVWYQPGVQSVLRPDHGALCAVRAVSVVAETSLLLLHAHKIQSFPANMPMPALNHIPSLFLATTFTFGGMLPIFAPARAMHEFGFPAHIIASPEAQSVFNVYSSRMTAFGLAIYAFHWKGMYEAVDIVLMTMAYATVVDAWICWKEKAPGSAAFRGISGLVVAGLGLWGITAW
jgi:hypothetical protein